MIREALHESCMVVLDKGLSYLLNVFFFQTINPVQDVVGAAEKFRVEPKIL